MGILLSLIGYIVLGLILFVTVNIYMLKKIYDNLNDVLSFDEICEIILSMFYDDMHKTELKTESTNNKDMDKLNYVNIIKFIMIHVLWPISLVYLIIRFKTSYENYLNILKKYIEESK